MYRRFMKPLLDRIIALIALIVLSPVFVILYLLVWRNMGRPVFFVQERPGLGGKIFKMIKFRTMTDDQDSKGKLLPDNRRIVPIGNFLRRSSLDELPELVNVLKGEMSLVGPRPLRVQYLPYYTESERIRFTVLPGITGLAQISGRTSINWDKRLEYDIEYVKNISFLLDLMILFQTIKKVVSRDNAESNTELMDFDVERLNKQTLHTKDK